MEHRDMQYLNMRSLQERPVTLGELLLREEGIESLEGLEAPTPRPMGRTMSPTRCLGPLVIGRPRRPRGRTLARPSTSTDELEDGPSEFRQSRLSQHRRRRVPTGPHSVPALSRWRNSTAEARIRNFYSLLNGPRPSRRRGNSTATRPRHRSLGRSDSPDLFFNPFSWQRRNTAVGFQTRSRSVTNSGTRARPLLQGRPRLSFARTSSGSSRMIDVYDSREETRASSYRYLRAGRPHSGRPDPETRRNTTSGSSRSDIPAAMRRFIDFAAEFIPVQQQPPDAEPPEWSLNVTAADFGPFAIGRSALSRARSLAIMGVLSQVNDDVNNDGGGDNPTDQKPNPNDN